MRVAIAHESRGVTSALRQAIALVRSWQVAWTADDCEAAVARCLAEPPDMLVVSPGLRGGPAADAIRRLGREAPGVVVVVVRGPQTEAASVFDALGAGAVTAITAPSVAADGRLAGLDEVARRLRAAGRLTTKAPGPGQPSPQEPPEARPPLVAIGASTGGPAAVAAVLGALPAALDACVVVVQHVDAQFAPNLVAWLSGHTSLAVRLVAGGDEPRQGTVSVTGTNDDLVLTARRTYSYRQPRDGTFYHPSVDVFFESVAAHWPAPGVAVLLTGIGRDGAAGLLALRRKGWHTIAQDEGSSVVYGMPKAAAELNAAVEILPIEGIGPAIVRALGRVTGKRGTRG
jgi:two-component system response regulator WspF